ncbi:MAG TPA: hypothetical protein VN657_05330, partial [Nitrospiraceae bacterium]|nr:hypothetical protein [Nitrospiraceae bacterium]
IHKITPGISFVCSSAAHSPFQTIDDSRLARQVTESKEVFGRYRGTLDVMDDCSDDGVLPR